MPRSAEKRLEKQAMYVSGLARDEYDDSLSTIRDLEEIIADRQERVDVEMSFLKEDKRMLEEEKGMLDERKRLAFRTIAQTAKELKQKALDELFTKVTGLDELPSDSDDDDDEDEESSQDGDCGQCPACLADEAKKQQLANGDASDEDDSEAAAEELEQLVKGIDTEENESDGEEPKEPKAAALVKVEASAVQKKFKAVTGGPGSGVGIKKRERDPAPAVEAVPASSTQSAFPPPSRDPAADSSKKARVTTGEDKQKGPAEASRGYKRRVSVVKPDTKKRA